METYIFVRKGYMWSFNDYNDRSRVHLTSCRFADFVIHARGGMFAIVKNRKDHKEYWSPDFNAIRRYIQQWYNSGVQTDLLGCVHSASIDLAELIEDRSDRPDVEGLQQMLEKL